MEMYTNNNTFTKLLDSVEIGQWDSMEIMGVWENLKMTNPGDPKSKSYLVQRISMAVQGGMLYPKLFPLPDADGFEVVFGLYFMNCLLNYQIKFSF